MEDFVPPRRCEVINLLVDADIAEALKPESQHLSHNLAMCMAGPRETVWHAIVIQNFGFSHNIHWPKARVPTCRKCSRALGKLSFIHGIVHNTDIQFKPTGDLLNAATNARRRRL